MKKNKIKHGKSKKWTQPERQSRGQEIKESIKGKERSEVGLDEVEGEIDWVVVGWCSSSGQMTTTST